MFSNLLFLIYAIVLTLFVDDNQQQGWINLLSLLPLFLFSYTLKLKLKYFLTLVSAYLTGVTFFGLITFSPLIPLSFLAAFWLHVKKKPYDKTAFRFILPFSLPYVIAAPFGIFLEGNLSLILIVLSTIALFAFFPYAVQKIWRSTPLPESELKTELMALCEKARFKHGGLLEWKILSNMLTAGIMGVVPRFRYVLFTPLLLRNLNPDAIKAVLAHEIGHHHYRHLWIFPFLLLTLFLTASWGVYLSRIENFYAANLLFIVIAVLFFRFVGGYFSRLFERQADLYAIKLGIPAEDVIEALDDIGNYTGKSHKTPSWHHFSIQERIDFLNAVKEDPNMASQHHLKTYLSLGVLAIYLIFLML